MSYDFCRQGQRSRRPPRLSPQEQILDWADPDPRQFSGAAFSEEHMMEIYTEVTKLRREFLRREIVGRLTGEVVEVDGFETAEQYLESLPHIPYVDRRTNIELGEQVSGWFTETDARSHWNKLMEYYADQAGFRTWATKYDDFYYKADRETPHYWAELERRFERAHERSQWLSAWGFDIDFMMDGINYVSQAAVRLETLEQALRNFEYMKSSSIVEKYYPAPFAYWQPLVERVAQQQANIGSYAQVIAEIEEGVYHAPYFHPALREDGDFFNLDDVNRACYALGINDKLRQRMWVFMLQYGLTEPGFHEVASRMYRGGVSTRESGVIFMDKDLLMEIDEELGETREKSKISNSAREVIRLLGVGDEYEVDYEYLAFHR